jgi:hypothetical protein
MQLAMDEVAARMAADWNGRAVVVPYRISGNRYVYSVTDHGEHWMPLDTSWVGGHQVFEPTEGSWPWRKTPSRRHRHLATRGSIQLTCAATERIMWPHVRRENQAQ